MRRRVEMAGSSARRWPCLVLLDGQPVHRRARRRDASRPPGGAFELRPRRTRPRDGRRSTSRARPNTTSGTGAAGAPRALNQHRERRTPMQQVDDFASEIASRPPSRVRPAQVPASAARRSRCRQQANVRPSAGECQVLGAAHIALLAHADSSAGFPLSIVRSVAIRLHPWRGPCVRPSMSLLSAREHAGKRRRVEHAAVSINTEIREFAMSRSLTGGGGTATRTTEIRNFIG